jgi:hypothetical protein
MAKQEIEIPVYTFYECQDCGEQDKDRGDSGSAPLELYCFKRYDGRHNSGPTMIKIRTEPRD